MNTVADESFLALLAVNQRIGESGQVPGGLPDLRMHEDRGVESHDVPAVGHHCLPPRFLDVAFELDAQGAVVPAAVKPAVDFAGLKDKAFSFAQAYDGTHQIGTRRHYASGNGK
jgi:hypothetical protein